MAGQTSRPGTRTPPSKRLRFRPRSGPAEPFVLAVLFGANMSYATPMAYNTNLLVMSAGNYTFAEFVKVGVPLTLLMWVVLTAVLAFAYNL